DHGGVVGHVECHDLRFLGDAGIAGCTIEALGQRARRYLPSERVLTSAGAEKKDVHIRIPEELGCGRDLPRGSAAATITGRRDACHPILPFNYHSWPKARRRRLRTEAALAAGRLSAVSSAALVMPALPAAQTSRSVIRACGNFPRACSRPPEVQNED